MTYRARCHGRRTTRRRPERWLLTMWPGGFRIAPRDPRPPAGYVTVTSIDRTAGTVTLVGVEDSYSFRVGREREIRERCRGRW